MLGLASLLLAGGWWSSHRGGPATVAVPVASAPAAPVATPSASALPAAPQTVELSVRATPRSAHIYFDDADLSAVYSVVDAIPASENRAIVIFRVVSPIRIGMRKRTRSHTLRPLSVFFHLKNPKIPPNHTGKMMYQ